MKHWLDNFHSTNDNTTNLQIHQVKILSNKMALVSWLQLSVEAQKRQDVNMEATIVNAINFIFIRLNNKKKVTSQRIFSFINKGALQLY